MAEVTILNPSLDLEHTVLEGELSEDNTVLTSIALGNLGTIRALTIGEKRISLTDFTYTTVNQSGVFTFLNGTEITAGSLLFITYR